MLDSLPMRVKFNAVRRCSRRCALTAVTGVSPPAAAGSGSDPTALLRQTFSGSHTVNSGTLRFALTVTPSGSTSITTPISLSFGGPFQLHGTGTLPASNFNLNISGFGRSGSVGLLSTGTSGYVTLSGTSYQLPAATFQKLESSFASVAASGSGGKGGALSKAGIHPLNWLTSPAVVGHDTIAGASTTHIRAGVNLTAFLGDISTLVQKAPATGVTGASSLANGIPAATRQKIANSVHGATVDIWTGTSDKTLRRIAIRLIVPVTGQTSTLLGGLRTAGLSLDMQYGDLNQPQQIAAPATVRPYSEFQHKLQSLLASIQSAGQGALGGGSTGTGSTGTGSTGGAATAPSAGGASASVQAYSACLQSAGTDVTKMQACASLLSGK